MWDLHFENKVFRNSNVEDLNFSKLHKDSNLLKHFKLLRLSFCRLQFWKAWSFEDLDFLLLTVVPKGKKYFLAKAPVGVFTWFCGGLILER